MRPKPKHQYEYSGKEDAEEILTDVMKRTRYGYELRDKLSVALEQIVERENSVKSEVASMAKTRRNRRGRKRKNQPRHKSGQLIRERPEEVAVQARMRHMRISRTVARTQEAGHSIDPFRRSGEITQEQFDAAVHWNKTVRDNAWAILTTRMRSGSDFSGVGGHDNSDGTEPPYVEQCQRARRKYHEIRHAVLCSDNFGMMAMQMACEDQPFPRQLIGAYRMAANAINRITN